MTVRIKEMIDAISRKAENNPMLAKIIKTKLILNGIDPIKMTAETQDDPLIIAKLEKLAKEL